MKKFLAIILFVLLSFNVFAETTGNELHTFWIEYQKAQITNNVSWTNVGLYMGYISGILELMDDLNYLSHPSIQYSQVFQIVGNYLDKHPELWNNNADKIVYWALTEVYPIKK